jgi:hypothetical protein
MDFQVRIEGADQLIAKLAQAPSIAAPILQRALSASQAILAKYTVKGIVPWRTGFLTQSFRAELTTAFLRWFPTASYAPYVEFGTKPHVITAKNARVLANRQTGQIFGKRVNHPGTRPNPFMERIVSAAQPDIDKMFGATLSQIVQAIATQ